MTITTGKGGTITVTANPSNIGSVTHYLAGGGYHVFTASGDSSQGSATTTFDGWSLQVIDTGSYWYKRDGSSYVTVKTTERRSREFVVSDDFAGSVSNTAEYTRKYTIKLKYACGGYQGITIDASLPDTQSYKGKDSSHQFTVADGISYGGLEFVGWKIGDMTYQPGESVSLTRDRTATAQWRLASHKITFEAYDYDTNEPLGKTGDEVASASPGHTFQLLQPPEYPGEVFVKVWSDDIDVTVTPERINVDGFDCEIKGVVLYLGSDSGISSATRELSDYSPFVLTSSQRDSKDVFLRFKYKKIAYNASAEVDSDSQGKLSVSVSKGQGIKYKEIVSFEATKLFDQSSGYVFAGWFYGASNDSLVSGSNPYAKEITQNTTLCARAGVLCNLSIVYPANTTQKTCRITRTTKTESGQTIGSQTSTEALEEFGVVLGRKFDFSISLGEIDENRRWVLDKWTEGSVDGERKNYGLTTTNYQPTGPMKLFAHVKIYDATPSPSPSPVDPELVKTLTVKTGEWASSPSQYEAKAPKRVIEEEGGTKTLVPILDPYEFEGLTNGLSDDGPVNEPTNEVVPAGQFSKEFVGEQRVRLTAKHNIVYFGSDTESRKMFKGFYGEDGTRVSSSRTVTLGLSDNLSVWALYGDASLIELSVGYAEPTGSGMGDVMIESITDSTEGAYISSDGKKAVLTQGQSATLVAMPRNGYRFVGWYDSVQTFGAPLSTSERFLHVTIEEKTIYARFASSATGGIYKWEGSANNKVMTWTSKTYVMQRPFDPVSARVDTTGSYGEVTLNVGTMSSPDKGPTKEHKITIKSQDGRRLPRMRPERFVNFTVTASEEVDAVVIGTNMAEAN